MSKSNKNKEEEIQDVNETEVIEEASENTLEEETAKLKEENASLQEKLLRHMAEFDNFKKRTAKEKQELASFTKALCLKDVLGVVDNFERALETECKDEEYKKGMTMIFNQLNEFLKAQGIEEIEAFNQPFDPELHNAVNQVEDENFGENTVCNVFQKGYKLGDKVVRHAMVVVANP